MKWYAILAIGISLTGALMIGFGEWSKVRLAEVAARAPDLHAIVRKPDAGCIPYSDRCCYETSEPGLLLCDGSARKYVQEQHCIQESELDPKRAAICSDLSGCCWYPNPGPHWKLTPVGDAGWIGYLQ